MKIFSNNFRTIGLIYSSPFTKTKINLLEDSQGKKYATKEILKEKLSENYMHEFAKNELAVHFSMCRKSPNIVKVYDYFEDEEKYAMIMEYSSEPNYFENRLENVKFIIFYIK
jgi:serine/threonine protein kinase